MLLSLSAGAIYPEWIRTPVAVTVNNLEGVVHEIDKDNLNFFLFVLLKNLSVALFVIFVWEIARFGNRLRRSLARVLPFKLVQQILSVPVERSAKFIPVVVLVVNGLIISGAVWYFSTEGIPASVSALGMLPHGIPELSALCLACGIGMSDMMAHDRARTFFRLVLPLFVVAAVLETWISPLVMAWMWAKTGL
nr:stage II sporulation protein M [Desulfofundulus thermobenzoicus]